MKLTNKQRYERDLMRLARTYHIDEHVSFNAAMQVMRDFADRHMTACKVTNKLLTKSEWLEGKKRPLFREIGKRIRVVR